nr:MAG TPA: NinG recombination protein [Caudoviricetes sp.]
MVPFDYNSPNWRRKRLQILKRDGYMCQHCKRYGKAVPATTVHHIQHADEYPEMAFADKNLISLCEGCHNKQHPEKAAAARGRY